MFEPPRLFYQRERALWVPRADQVAALAHWLHGCGVHTLVVVMPHAQGALPPALAHGLASLSEQVVSSLGFARVVWLRSAEKRPKPPAASLLHRARDLVLSTLAYMVPASEQPLRAAQVAQVLARVLQHAPPASMWCRTHASARPVPATRTPPCAAGLAPARVKRPWILLKTEHKKTI